MLLKIQHTDQSCVETFDSTLISFMLNVLLNHCQSSCFHGSPALFLSPVRFAAARLFFFKKDTAATASAQPATREEQATGEPSRLELRHRGCGARPASPRGEPRLQLRSSRRPPAFLVSLHPLPGRQCSTLPSRSSARRNERQQATVPLF